ncbi:MAG TPA: LPS export ABC transporter permease LptG [Thermoanaerobaculia bacterium]|nr:LPS export ABC transporter permease LptG [Thermoanaerobaculia bacterium]
MKILTRYILKEMIGPTVLGFLFYTSIILMQRLFDMAGLIIRRSLSGAAVGKLLALSLPHIIVLTVPMSLLFGILIAVGRLSADSEIIAMRALGISTRTIYRPVFLFSVAIFLVNLYLINYVMPKGNAQFQALRAEILTSSAEKEIKPRVFYDEYENLMIYVNDIDPRTAQWKGVFVADTRGDEAAEAAAIANNESVTAPPPDREDNVGSLGRGGGQRIIVAERGNLSLVKRKPAKDVWMNLYGAQTHVWDPRKPDRYDLNRNAAQRILLPSLGSSGEPENGKVARSLREMDLRELVEQEQQLRKSTDRQTYNLARVEIHKKFAIPFACIAFGVLGLPLGITNRRGGKSSGFSLSILIILFYYVMINNGEHLAAAGKLSPGIAMWAANVILLAIGTFLLSRANRDIGAQRSEGGVFKRMALAIGARMQRRRDRDRDTVVEGSTVLNRLDITFPNIIDRYVLREFLKILAMVSISVIVLFVVVEYTDLSREIRQNDVAASTVIAYYRFRMFEILNQTLPISVLVATLVTFGILSKNNEVTAIKSGGVSLYRIALPIIAVAVVLSIISYLLVDFVLPYSTQRAYELKRRIEGKPAVTAASQQKLWYRGKGHNPDYVINFLSYNRQRKQLSQVQVFEFQPEPFKLTRRVYARRAVWNGKGWAFEDGWMRSFLDDGSSTFTPIRQPLALFYPETPEDFATEVKPPEQMTFAQLHRYIDTVRKSGYSAEELAVRLYWKTSWPVISIVMALIALPFAFKMGKRGTLYGIGIALVVGILYWTVFGVFTKFGEVGNLPPLLAAWSANILFAIVAIYLFLNVET